MRLLSAVIATSMLAVAPALAQENSDHRFEGASVTIIGGAGAEKWSDDYKASPVYGLQLNFNWQRDALVLGVEGEITGSAGDHCDTVYLPNGGSTSSCVSPTRDLYVGGRIGVAVGRSTLIYVKGGYTNVRLDYDRPTPAAPSARFTGSSDVHGFEAGTGIEQQLGERFSLKAEYRYSNYGGDYFRHQFVLGLGARF